MQFFTATELAFGLLILTIADVGKCRSQYGRSRHNFPNPITNPFVCGRERQRSSYVCDPDKVLGSQDTEASQLDELIAKIVNETKCPCSSFTCENNRIASGYKIGIAVTKRIIPDEEYNAELDEEFDPRETQIKMIQKNLHEAQLFAHALQQQWKLGKCDEDVIIFYSQEDNVVYTVTGDVARMRLANELVASISLNARRTGFYRSPFDGLWAIVNDYRAVFMKSYRPKEGPKKGQSKQPSTGSIHNLPSFKLVMFICLASLYKLI